MRLIKPRFFLLEEDISNWPSEEQVAIGKLYTIWFYNDHERTYCCEMTPSIEGRYLGFVTQNAVSDKVHDAITEAYSDEYVSYWHVNNLPDNVASHPDYELEDADEEALQDYLFDEYVCNQVWFTEWNKILGENNNVTV